MDIVVILRQLWRWKRLVAVTALVAILIGASTAYHIGAGGISSRQYTVGVASARALVDTPNSQVVDLGLKEDANAGVLPARAVLLANLLTTSPLKDELARRSGVAPDKVIAVADTPTDTGAPVDKPLATGASVKLDDPRANIVTAHTDESLPLITVNAQAPSPVTAARLADNAIAVLTEHVQQLSSTESVPDKRRLIVERLGVARSGTEQRGPSRLVALVLTIVVFVLGCALLVLVSALARNWRRVLALEEAQGDVAPWTDEAAADDDWAEPVVLEPAEDDELDRRARDDAVA